MVCEAFALIFSLILSAYLLFSSPKLPECMLFQGDQDMDLYHAVLTVATTDEQPLHRTRSTSTTMSKLLEDIGTQEGDSKNSVGDEWDRRVSQKAGAFKRRRWSQLMTSTGGSGGWCLMASSKASRGAKVPFQSFFTLIGTISKLLKLMHDFINSM